MPILHIGDSDPYNEVTAQYLANDPDSKRVDRGPHLEKLIQNRIVFSNYHNACGQYHSIGEMVMQNLLSTDSDIREKLVQTPIPENDEQGVSCYICCFSLGGGTGCGTSTVLIGEVNREVRQKKRTLFTTAIGILPEGGDEAENLHISAGRFLVKYFGI